jgi:tRNA(fMet)-specific endonuclease VapC
MKYLLDTDTFSEMVKGVNPGIIKRLDTLQTSDAALSVVSYGEIVSGLRAKSIKQIVRQRLDRLLEGVEIIPIDAHVAEEYGALRALLRTKGTPIGPNDLWIAAHSLATGLTLVSHNVREFARVPKIKLEDWVASK